MGAWGGEKKKRKIMQGRVTEKKKIPAG